MKFSASTLLVILPLLAAQASALALPEDGLVGRAKGAKGAAGSKGKGGAAAGGAAAGGAAAGAANSTAANSTAAGAAGAAANSTAATGAAAAANSTAATGAAAAANSTASDSGNAQTSLTLDPAVIAQGFAQNGQATQEAGQVASLTSTNNFINFCATTNQPITNGQQVKTGSCNPAPMGQIPATTAMPSAKFQFPTNMQNIAANQAFTVKMAIANMETGNFVNAQQNYFAAPQQLNAQGQIVGHSHIVIEPLSSITQTTPTDPTKFSFFQGLNAAAVGGVLTADVSAGLPAGTYKVSSINTAANHQPALVPVAQHGSLDDAVYFTVGGAGAAPNSTAAAGGAAAASNSTAATGAAAASNSTAATGAAAASNSTAATGAAAASNSTAATGAAAGGAAGAGAKGKGAGAAAASGAGAKGGKGKTGKGRRFIRASS